MARKMEGSRRALALFQHHDGITGTAKDHVVEDYGKRMLDGLHEAKRIVAECSAFLLHEDKKMYNYLESDGPEYGHDETRQSHNSLPEKPVLRVKDMLVSSGGAPVILYNSLAQPRVEVVSVHTDWPYVKVTGPDGVSLHSQVEPLWPVEKGPESSLILGVYSVKFVANLTGLAVTK